MACRSENRNSKQGFLRRPLFRKACVLLESTRQCVLSCEHMQRRTLAHDCLPTLK